MKLKRSIRLLLTLMPLLAALAACAHKDASTPRPQASYRHWLEKQSMLAETSNLIEQVSQTERVWLKSGHANQPDILLRAAPTWLLLRAEKGDRQFFRRLGQTLGILPKVGITGVYLGQMGENLDIWLNGDGNGSSPGASLAINSQLGAPGEYEEIISLAEKDGIETGSDLVPAATGRGPDFILQARNAPGYHGLYAMLPAPAEIWNGLPQAGAEWDALPLSAQTEARLAAENILPEKMRRDELDWLPPSGWAATGVIHGLDGQPRRWLYRYEAAPDQPVFAWQDPGGAARRIYAAAIIRQTGLDGQTLTGLRLGALAGLEPSGNMVPRADELQPALEAANELAAQIHRYGGWAFFADPLPVSGIKQVLAGSCDFCADYLTPLLVDYAIAAADPKPLAALSRSMAGAGIAQNRLVRGLSPAGLDMAKSLPESDKIIEILRNSQEYQAKGTPTARVKSKAGRLALEIALGLPGLVFLDREYLPDAGKESQGDVPLPERLLRHRLENGLALGQVIESGSQGQGLFYALTQLETNKLWLLACNFSGEKAALEIRLPFAAKSALDAADGRKLSENLHSSGQKFSLALDGLQARNVLFN